jgi:hypothetical protein
MSWQASRKPKSSSVMAREEYFGSRSCFAATSLFAQEDGVQCAVRLTGVHVPRSMREVNQLRAITVVLVALTITPALQSPLAAWSRHRSGGASLLRQALEDAVAGESTERCSLSYSRQPRSHTLKPITGRTATAGGASQQQSSA